MDEIYLFVDFWCFMVLSIVVSFMLSLELDVFLSLFQKYDLFSGSTIL